MFEVDDAYIHIDLKTVQTSNIGDFSKNIFVGNNQISYNSSYSVSGVSREFSSANLPPIYNKNYNGIIENKYCLTYFLSILHDEKSLNTICMYITCCPNGLLQPIYQGDVFQAGKNLDKVRYDIKKCRDFRLINATRIKVIFFNDNITKEYLKKLQFIYDCYIKQ